MAFTAPMRPAEVAAALAADGITVAAETLQQRDDRMAAHLPGNRMVWYPTNAKGRERLQREARVLELIDSHCSFRVPKVLTDAPAGWQLREIVPGTADPFAVYERVKGDTGYAAVVGEQFGVLLADQHLNVPKAGLAEFLPPTPDWPPPLAWVAGRLPGVTADATLIRRAVGVIEEAEALEQHVTDRALTHNDFGFHNVVVDLETGAVAGVFDYDGAAFADRHHDFKCLLLDIAGETLLDSAMATYAAAGGAPVDRSRLYLLNAAAAVAFLAYRAGSGPDDRPAGRTLAEDLRWTNIALDRAGR